MLILENSSTAQKFLNVIAIRYLNKIVTELLRGNIILSLLLVSKEDIT